MSTKQIPRPEKIAFGDFENELNNTRKVLERVPGDKLSWKPHEKSMSLGELAQHVANLPWFAQIAVTQDEYDLAGWQRPAQLGSTREILALFEEKAAAAQAALAQVSPEALLDPWSLRMGEQVFFTHPRVAVVRGMCISHIVHHRAQLTVYLRLLNVPVPGLYGPSADEQ